ncbi:MAG: NADP-dependent oxidoreductase, partial [Pseudomonadales bacterium]|nr:NADP-dependent oxidoreductase [Pseudomonadales bacterium]
MQTIPATNKAIQFVKRPNGKPTPDIFSPKELLLSSLRANEFLIKNLYLSMDPALVGRMRDEDNYAESVVPGDVMHAYGIGQVIASNHTQVKVGEVRLGRFDMQEYSVQTNPDDSRVINLGLAKPTWYLGPVGITGATAYFGLFDIAKPKRGDTVVISAGASSVGSIVAQLAKSVGCRVVAIVSNEEKAAQVKMDFGYDAAVTYRNKSISDIESDLKNACPQGIDIYFDNVSGDISEALLDLYNEKARIVVCGRLGISHLSDTKNDIGRRDNNAILSKRIRKQGFVLLDYQSRMMEAVIQLAAWVRQGKLVIKEDIIEGVDNIPKAFFRMLDGESQGKQLVHLANVDDAIDPAPRWLGAALTSSQFPRKPVLKAVSKAMSLKSQ